LGEGKEKYPDLQAGYKRRKKGLGRLRPRSLSPKNREREISVNKKKGI